MIEVIGPGPARFLYIVLNSSSNKLMWVECHSLKNLHKCGRSGYVHEIFHKVTRENYEDKIVSVDLCVLNSSFVICVCMIAYK